MKTTLQTAATTKTARRPAGRPARTPEAAAGRTVLVGKRLPKADADRIDDEMEAAMVLLRLQAVK